MTRYWSDQFGIYIDGENVWDGRTPLTDGLGWRQREAPLQTVAPYQSERTDAPRPAGGVCRCGHWMAQYRRACNRCRRLARRVVPRLCGCGVTLRAKCRVCERCKKQQAKVKREAA